MLYVLSPCNAWWIQVRLDDVSAANLPGFVNSANIPSALNRVLVWSVWYDMTRDAEMSARTFLALARDIVRWQPWLHTFAHVNAACHVVTPSCPARQTARS